MNTPDRPLPPLPTFLIIGAQKSATRWLRVNLGKHPDVYTASRELSFFNKAGMVRRIGLEGYRAQFDGWNGEPVVGEATPGYMIWRHDPTKTARRIERSLPEVRLIAILRNPVDRANSALLHHQRRNRISKRSTLVREVARRSPEHDQQSLIAGGWYAASLRPYRKRFRKRLLVLLHDEIAHDPRAVYRRALLHIGAEPSFVPDTLERVVFSNRRGNGDDALSPEDRRLVFEYFRDDMEDLQRMVGPRVAQWDPDWQPDEIDDDPSSNGDPLDEHADQAVDEL